MKFNYVSNIEHNEMSIKIVSKSLKCFPFSYNVFRAAEISVLVQCLEKWSEEINVITSLN